MDAPHIDLSTRERDILAMRVDYHSTREIAEKFGLSIKTIESHLHNARNKFGARSTGELLRRARLQGITSEQGAATS